MDRGEPYQCLDYTIPKRRVYDIYKHTTRQKPRRPHQLLHALIPGLVRTLRSHPKARPNDTYTGPKLNPIRETTRRESPGIYLL